MPDPRKQARIEEFMRKRLLGEELIDTQFHLFSARSPLAGRVLKPRALCANNVLLAKSSKYFLDLLSTDIHPSHPSLADLADDHDIPGSAPVDEYGYESDSDLDECNDSIQVTCPEAQKDRSASKDDKLYVDGPGSVRSDMVVSPEQPREEGSFAVNLDGAGSIASSETAIQEHAGDNLKELATRNQMAMRLRSLASRHVFVKDTAFQTWYTLLNYLHTDKFNFLPLKSTTPSGQPRASSTSSLDEPRCSAKSMYRLACKVGLDRLRDEAFAHIRSNLTEHNIIQELSCSLLSTHPELLKMELDVLYAHMASPPVVAHFPGLARRIANKELAHGADIVIWTHTQLLKVSPSRTQPSSGSGLWQTAPSRLGSGLGLRNAASAGPADGAERAAASAGDTSKGDVKGEDGNQRTGVACDPAPVPAPAFAPLGVNVGPVPLPSSSWTKVPSAFGPPSPSWFVPPPSSTTSEATFGSLRGQPSQATTSSSGGKEGVACDPPPAPSFVVTTLIDNFRGQGIRPGIDIYIGVGSTVPNDDLSRVKAMQAFSPSTDLLLQGPQSHHSHSLRKRDRHCLVKNTRQVQKNQKRYHEQSFWSVRDRSRINTPSAELKPVFFCYLICGTQTVYFCSRS
ncbi:hypothetical protein EV363DRAFT_1435290 [Boletus edulis]|nr:hypothetical protein EV363DRAFT_1435290 [Boletus edulis]